MRLENKVCVITGGAAGIGKATAIRFAEQKAKVIICDVDQDQGEAVAKDIGADFYPVNVADRQAVQAFMDEVISKYKKVDVLVNNAGILRDGQLVKVKEGQLVKQMAEEDFDLVIDTTQKLDISIEITNIGDLRGGEGATIVVVGTWRFRCQISYFNGLTIATIRRRPIAEARGPPGLTVPLRKIGEGILPSQNAIANTVLRFTIL